MTAQALLASVVICTRNRARSLARTLESLVVAAAQTRELWELIVVDNGSSDDTAATVETFAARLPIRLVSQPLAGLSNARNAGVAAARGDYMLWTDDDVMVDPQWLAAWFRAFRARPNDAVFGGRTEPRFEEPRQDWFVAGQEHLGSLLAVRDADWTEISPKELPWGLNFAVRAIEQRRYPYDPELGVAPGRRRGGEEVAVINAILAEGGSGSWVWDATVYHLIPAERQTRHYIDTFYQAHGNDYPVFGPSHGMRKRFNAIRRAINRIGKLAITLRSPGLAGPDRVARLVELARLRGSLATYLRSPLHERR
jgi:glycosyltransferase involved in cell wall biosynthesis